MTEPTEPIKTEVAIPEQPKCGNCGGTGQKSVKRGGRFIWEDCPKCTKQPNQNLMLIDEIEGLLSQVNEKLDGLNNNITNQEPGDSNRKYRVNQALEETDSFQKTKMHDLRKAFE